MIVLHIAASVAAALLAIIANRDGNSEATVAWMVVVLYATACFVDVI